jgi:hypothetical protein
MSVAPRAYGPSMVRLCTVSNCEDYQMSNNYPWAPGMGGRVLKMFGIPLGVLALAALANVGKHEPTKSAMDQSPAAFVGGTPRQQVFRDYMDQRISIDESTLSAFKGMSDCGVSSLATCRAAMRRVEQATQTAYDQTHALSIPDDCIAANHHEHEAILSSYVRVAADSINVLDRFDNSAAAIVLARFGAINQRLNQEAESLPQVIGACKAKLGM